MNSSTRSAKSSTHELLRRTRPHRPSDCQIPGARGKMPELVSQEVQFSSSPRARQTEVISQKIHEACIPLPTQTSNLCLPDTRPIRKVRISSLGQKRKLKHRLRAPLQSRWRARQQSTSRQIHVKFSIKHCRQTRKCVSTVKPQTLNTKKPFSRLPGKSKIPVLLKRTSTERDCRI